MGKTERNRGNAFERLICNVVRSLDPYALVRRGKQSHLADEPDVVIAAGMGRLNTLWIECHHGKTPAHAKLIQAEHDALYSTRGTYWSPVVIWRKPRERVVYATMRLGVLDRVRDHTTHSVNGNAFIVTMPMADFFAMAALP